ncbi:DUF4113 domain-containing protein [Kosakonia sp. S58]|uniref:DUF4113 domain-containing protein n=1 Tax=unclassified Kosakonia TaxID=2632876 RepID=UPI0019061D77|nr:MULTISPECIES: DUF4113 domain-containing protein [unclassified Kosakonia]MBK0078718.1 DUF4113 domain-containing protein [Kosakonia sp. S57]MBK0085427.1 DUF4113 domain-containing protein [Kosakonia sp. S58]
MSVRFLPKADVADLSLYWFTGSRSAWLMKRKILSPRNTTRLSDLPIVKANL